MRILLVALGQPEEQQRFIHIAGTNGKGSTAAMVAAALRSAGLRAGLYTSPHLVSPTERIQVNEKLISEDDFTSAFDEVHRKSEQLIATLQIDAHPSYFETVTAMAFLYLRDKADLSVIEVGLGGRLDATNVVNPKLAIITPISFDHEAFLGNTLESIAAEKAGIIKPGVPVVVSRQDARAMAVIAARAAELGSTLINAERVTPEQVECSAAGSTFVLDGVPFECSLPGRHQIENATTAIVACRELGIIDSAIQQGLRNARWPGRLERVQENPVIVLDGAHNPSGAAALASYIKEFCSDRPVWLIYGAMRDKAIEEVTSLLFPLADCLIVTAPDFPRALRPEAILEVTQHGNATAAATLEEALRLAGDAPADASVFITGSLYLVGEARRILDLGTKLAR